MDTSADLYKDSIDKAFSELGTSLNTSTMRDANKYKQSFKEEELEGGVADKKTLKDIAIMHAYDDSKDSTSKDRIKKMFVLLKQQLNKGIKVEMEHVKDKDKAKEIAMDHLFEDPNYYDKLKKIENKEENEKKYLDIQDMIPMLRKQLNKGTMFDPDLKKQDETPKKKNTKRRSKSEPNEATSSGSSGAYSAPLFSGEEPDLDKFETKESSTGRMSPIGFSDEYIKKSNSEKKGVTEDLGRWFKEKWVDVSKKVDGKHPPCGRKDADGKAYPKCRPSKKVSKETPKVASSYDKDEKKKMTQQKRRAEKKDPKVGKGNTPTMTRFDEVKNISIKEQVEKVEATEATTSGSVGGYETPAMWAKSTKKKDWGPSRKTQIPGGGFVKIKKKCTKFPYCNQGDISNLKISKNESVKDAIKQVATKMGVSENVIITILEHEYEKVNKRKK